MAQIRPLSPELNLVAQKELNETEEIIQSNIIELRQWIEHQTYLTARTSDQFLLSFLRFCKHDVEATKKRIDYYYTYKTNAGDLLKIRIIDDKLFDICKAGIFATLPKPAGPAGPRIHFTRMGNIDTSLYTVKDLFRFQMFRSEMEINTDDNWIISGVLEIIDFRKIPFGILRQFEPSLFKKMAAFLEYGVPTNLVATHIFNASKEVQLILSLVRNLMKQKELLHIHSSIESLQKAIGKEYLPEEYGGDNGTIDEAISLYEAKLNSFRTYFSEDEKYGVDENLRYKVTATPPKLCSPVDGNFRKLDID